MEHPPSKQRATTSRAFEAVPTSAMGAGHHALASQVSAMLEEGSEYHDYVSDEWYMWAERFVVILSRHRAKPARASRYPGQSAQPCYRSLLPEVARAFRPPAPGAAP
eukprot:2545694-Pyramimonas_sp.AAC.1